MKTDLNKFFDLIQQAKASGLYSNHEIKFFYDVWKATYYKNLEDKHKGKKDKSITVLLDKFF